MLVPLRFSWSVYKQAWVVVRQRRRRQERMASSMSVPILSGRCRCTAQDVCWRTICKSCMFCTITVMMVLRMCWTLWLLKEASAAYRFSSPLWHASLYRTHSESGMIRIPNMKSATCTGVHSATPRPRNQPHHRTSGTPGVPARLPDCAALTNPNLVA